MMNPNLYAQLELGFPSDHQSCCIETHDQLYYTWQDMRSGSAKIAHLLKQLGLPPGARILVQVEKSPEALMLYLACLRAGLVFVPLNTAYQSAEIAYFMQDAQASVVVCTPDRFTQISKLALQYEVAHVFTLANRTTPFKDSSLLQAAAAHPNEFETRHSNANDLAAILYTSGTTGRSKGAMLSHGNLSSNAKILSEVWAWQAKDVLLHCLPIFHVHGLFVASHLALMNGSKMIFLPKFDHDQIKEALPRSSVMMGVPTYYVRLLQDPQFNPEICQTMRLFVSGSAPLLPDTFAQFKAQTGHTILERYGMSETNILTSNPYQGERRSGSVGFALPQLQLRIVKENENEAAIDEIGELRVKGPNVFQGYWRMPEKTKEEFDEQGFFKTGDLGKREAQGYISIVGRSKDLIISGGYNVYPKEIEQWLDDMPEVAESAVIGIPHTDFGEAVCAVLVLKPDAQLTAEACIARLKTSIAHFKVPKRIQFAEALPRNTMGKVQKNVLRAGFTL